MLRLDKTLFNLMDLLLAFGKCHNYPLVVSYSIIFPSDPYAVNTIEIIIKLIISYLEPNNETKTIVIFLLQHSHKYTHVLPTSQDTVLPECVPVDFSV